MITDIGKIQYRFTEIIISVHSIISLINVRIVIPNIKNIILNETKLLLFLFNYEKFLEEYTNYNKNNLYDPYYREIKYMNFFHKNNWIQTKVKKENCLRNLYSTLRIESYYKSDEFSMSYYSISNINNKRRELQNDLSYLYKMLDYCTPYINCLNNHLNQNDSNQFNSNINQLILFRNKVNNYEYLNLNHKDEQMSDVNVTIFNTFIYAFKNNLPVTLPMICEKLNIKFDPKYNISDRPLHHIILDYKKDKFSIDGMYPIPYSQSPQYVYNSMHFETKPISPPDRFIPKLS